MTQKQLEILTNIIGAVESGGQIYGNRNYAAYAGAGKNSSNEVTCTLGWAQNYGNNARKLCQRIFEKDKAAFRKADTADIERKLFVDWIKTKWNPSLDERKALVSIITTKTGKECQDKLFQEDMILFIKDARTFGIHDIGAQMMYCEIRHLGGKSAAERIFKKIKKPYNVDKVYSTLLLDQKDTSNNNQVGDKLYQSRHECCVKWIKQYVGLKNNSTEDISVSYDINKVIKVASDERGYLEKASNSNLDSKIANAGSNNYTKYWRDMANLGLGNYQAQYWCACFVHWCFYKAYGLSESQKLLLQKFFINCQEMYNIASAKGQIYDTPEIGDVVLFYTSSTSQYGHTGIVVNVSDNCKTFTTIEGNTSGGSTVVANGGGVAEKTYVLSTLPRVKFMRPNYNSTSDTVTSSPTNTVTYNKTKKWTGIVTADSLNIRTGAGIEYDLCSFSPLKRNAEVEVCDSSIASDGSKWYYFNYKGKFGFAHSKYISKKQKTVSSSTDTTKKVEPAKSKDDKISGTYKTTSELNMRYKAGVLTSDNIVCVIPKGDKVQCYGYYTLVGGTKWYLVTYGAITGFVSSQYLSK